MTLPVKMLLIIGVLIIAFFIGFYLLKVNNQYLRTSTLPVTQPVSTTDEVIDVAYTCGHMDLGTLTYNHDTGVITCSVMGGTHNLVYDNNQDGIWDEGDFPPNISEHGWPDPLTTEQLSAILASTPLPTIGPDPTLAPYVDSEAPL